MFSFTATFKLKSGRCWVYLQIALAKEISIKLTCDACINLYKLLHSCYQCQSILASMLLLQDLCVLECMLQCTDLHCWQGVMCI